MPTPRSTAPSNAAATASRCSTPSCASRSSAASATSRSCATRWRRATSWRGSNPRWSCTPGASSAPRRLARWSHAERGISTRASSCRSPRRPARLRARRHDRALRGRSARGPAASPTSISTFRIWCNISAGQFTRARPIERLTGLLERTGCDPNLIGLEITETAILPDMQAAARRDRGGARARHQGRARRLRHRALVAHVAALAADRPREDRPDVRARARSRRARDRDRARCRHARRKTSVSRSWPKAWRPLRRPRCSASSAVSSRRDTCGRGRCRPSSSRRRCGRNARSIEACRRPRPRCPQPETGRAALRSTFPFRQR